MFKSLRAFHDSRLNFPCDGNLVQNGDKMTLKSKAPCFKSKFITAELAHLFSQSDSEEEFEGFSEDEEEEEDRGCFNKRLKNKVVDSEEDSDGDTGFYSDGEEAPPSKRRSLLVALRFPVKRLSTPKKEPQEKIIKKPVKETRPSQRASKRQRTKQQQQQQDGEEEEEEEEEEEVEEDKDKVLSQSLRKRDKNIKENKAMLAKLFADLSSMADLTLPSTPQKKKRVSEKSTPRKRKFEPEAGSERRNPSRKARPPENFAVEEKSEPLTCRSPKTVDIRRLVEVDKEHAGERRRRTTRVRKSQYDVRSVDEITKEDLDNIAYRSKDKIWDKENGSSCHQCRQKTVDTKTVCRSGFCVGAKGQFCGPCLKNRYGEDVRTVLLDPTWSCPLCRGMCNCSLCRKKEGRCATGILVGLARYNGHDNVHEYLESIQKELQ